MIINFTILLDRIPSEQPSKAALDVVLYLNEEPHPDPAQEAPPLFIFHIKYIIIITSSSRHGGAGSSHGLQNTEPPSRVTASTRDTHHTGERLLNEHKHVTSHCCLVVLMQMKRARRTLKTSVCKLQLCMCRF